MFNKRTVLRTILLHALKSVIAVALAGALISFFTWQINRIGASLSEKEKLVRILERRGETVAILERDLARINDPEGRIRSALLSSENILSFVSTLESLAAERGVIQQLQFGTPTVHPAGATPISVIGYSISVSGNAETFLQYLKRFESLNYFTGIRSLSVTAPENGWEKGASVLLSALLYVHDNE